MKKELFLVVMMTAPLFSGSSYDNQTGENIVNQISGDSTRVDTADKESAGPGGKKKNHSNYEEVVYHHLKKINRESNNKTFIVSSQKDEFARNLEGDYKEKLKKEEERRLALNKEIQTKEKQKAKEKIRFARGYCYLSNPVEINKIATYAYLNCDFQPPFNKAELAVSFVPEFYAKAAIASPLYITKDDIRFPISNGVVLTKDKNSINLANYVNDNMTKKIVASSGIAGVSAAALAATQFMEHKRESDREETVVTAGAGLANTVTKATTVKAPEIADYLVVAGVQLASSITKIVGEAYIKSLPYIFKVNKGSMFFVDLQIANDVNMEGYKIVQNNIIKKEPTLVNGIELPIEMEIVPILNDHSLANEGKEKTNLPAPVSKNKKITPLPALK